MSLMQFVFWLKPTRDISDRHTEHDFMVVEQRLSFGAADLLLENNCTFLTQICQTSRSNISPCKIICVWIIGSNALKLWSVQWDWLLDEKAKVFIRCLFREMQVCYGKVNFLKLIFLCPAHIRTWFPFQGCTQNVLTEVV